jgi:hypothetical protein
MSTFFDPVDRLKVDRYQSLSCAQPVKTAFELTRSEGCALTMEQAIELAHQG